MIVEDNGIRVEVKGRLAAMIRRLLCRRARIEEIPKGKVEIPFAGDQIRVLLHEAEEPTKVE